MPFVAMKKWEMQLEAKRVGLNLMLELLAAKEEVCWELHDLSDSIHELFHTGWYWDPKDQRRVPMVSLAESRNDIVRHLLNLCVLCGKKGKKIWKPIEEIMRLHLKKSESTEAE